MRGSYRVSKFSEYQGYSDRANYVKGTEIPYWMKGFARNAEAFVKSEQENAHPLGRVAVTIVNHNRERDEANIYQSMYSVMNGSRPTFSSVDEKVKDYHKKTGLESYLQKIKADLQVKEAAKEILRAAAEESDDETGAESPESVKKKDSIVPRIFIEIPGIEGSVRETVSKNHLLPIPAIVNIIAENLSNQYVKRELLLDDDLFRYINNIIISVSKPSADIGRFFSGDSSDGAAITSNDDPFSTLRG